MQPKINTGSPKIKLLVHCKPSKMVEIIKAIIGIITPMYPARAEQMFTNNFKYK